MVCDDAYGDDDDNGKNSDDDGCNNCSSISNEKWDITLCGVHV